uniref:Uncharacterized protein n=1 Tax=Timema shepardi TaxID=629360 RepID=A0A7R9B6B4_TIMSH|nr:unnamed protein product [Timema shepardi]
MIASHEATRKQHAHNATPLIFPVISFHSGRKQCARAGMFVDKTSHTQTEKRGTFGPRIYLLLVVTNATGPDDDLAYCHQASHLQPSKLGANWLVPSLGEVISKASDGGSQSSFRTKSQESLAKVPTRVSITQLPFTYEQAQRGCPTQVYGRVCPAAQPNSPPGKIEKAPSHINVAVSQDIQGHTALDDTKHVEVTKSIQRLLSRRRSPEARNVLLTFYDTVIEDIDAELTGTGERTKHVDLLYKQVEEGMRGQLSYLTQEMKSRRILTLLKNKLENRKKEVEKRVRALDEIEAIVHPGDEADMLDPSLDQSAVGSMWKNIVQQLPKPRSIKLLQNLYHPDVVDLYVGTFSLIHIHIHIHDWKIITL